MGRCFEDYCRLCVEFLKIYMTREFIFENGLRGWPKRRQLDAAARELFFEQQVEVLTAGEGIETHRT